MQQKRLDDAGRTRENALENEVVELRNVVDKGKKVSYDERMV